MSNTQALAEAGLPPRRLFLTVVPPIVLPVFLAAADPTAVATALPGIGAGLGHVELLSWLMIANLIASTLAAPAYGRLGDLFGRRRLMLVALGVFAAGAALCAFATGIVSLIGARVVQGLGGGGLMTLSQALIGAYVPGRARGRYQGYLASCIVAGSAIGPMGGGFLTQSLGWRAVFLAYLPLAAIGAVLVARLPRDVRPGGRVRFDALGMVLLAAFVVPLLLAVGRMQHPDPAALPAVAGFAALALAALAVLIFQQTRTAEPVLPLALLRVPSFWRADVMGACSGASLTAMVTFLPMYFQTVTHASAAESGLLLMPLAVSVSVGSVMTGWLISRTGRTAIFPGVGLVVTALTLVALAIWGPVLGRTELSVLLAVGGLCQGTAMLTAQITVLMVAEPHQLGAAAGSVQLSRSLGSAFGVALAGTVLFALMSGVDPAATHLFFASIRHGPDALASLPPDRQALVHGEIANAFRGVFLTVATFSCCIVAMAWGMPARRV